MAAADEADTPRFSSFLYLGRTTSYNLHISFDDSQTPHSIELIKIQFLKRKVKQLLESELSKLVSVKRGNRLLIKT